MAKTFLGRGCNERALPVDASSRLFTAAAALIGGRPGADMEYQVSSVETETFSVSLKKKYDLARMAG